MFKLGSSDHFWWPVKVSLPVDGSKYEAHTFQVRFARLSQEKLMAAYTAISRARDLSDQCAKERDLARALVVDWREVNGPDGSELAFSAQNLETVLDVPMVQAAVLNAYSDALKNANRKN